MNTIPILALAAGLGAAGGALTQVVLTPAEPAPAPVTVGDGELEAVRGELREAERRMDEMRAQLAELSERLHGAPALAARTPERDLEAVVRRVLEEQRAELAPAAAAAVARPEGDLDATTLMDQLLAFGPDSSEAQELWERAREAGLLDELIGAFERRAAERPNDPEAQYELGIALTAKIYDVGDGPERGLWATRSDQAFDRALELDPRHWNARFHKAVSLSFWPPLFGKQAEAIRHFEVLVEQQQGLALEPRYAQTYELLGNLYQQTGNAEEAQAAWRAGAELYPDVESLQAKLTE